PPVHCTLSLHDALPISCSVTREVATGLDAQRCVPCSANRIDAVPEPPYRGCCSRILVSNRRKGSSTRFTTRTWHRPPLALLRPRSEEHTSELQSRSDLV